MTSVAPVSQWPAWYFSAYGVEPEHDGDARLRVEPEHDGDAWLRVEPERDGDARVRGP